jgi:hypothetical protein
MNLWAAQATLSSGNSKHPVRCGKGVEGECTTPNPKSSSPVRKVQVIGTVPQYRSEEHQYHNNTHVPVVETRVRYLSCDFPLAFKSWLHKSASRDRHKTPYWLLLRSIIAAIVSRAFAPSRLSFSSHNTTVILDKACIVPERHYYCTTLIPSYLQTQERGECLADRPHDSDPSQTLMRRRPTQDTSILCSR